jgi:aryl carrier-like protein
VIFFINDQNESREILDNAWALNLEGYLFSCNEIKPKGKIEVIRFKGEMCEVNLSLSILYSEVSSIKGVRANRILKELDFSDIDDFLAEKSKEIDLSLPQIILSPILLPSRYFVEKNLNKDVKDYYSMNFSNDANIIYTGVDSIPMRRISFELRKKGKKVKEILLDVEPLLAPIYLSLMTYYMMEG